MFLVYNIVDGQKIALGYCLLAKKELRLKKKH